MTYAPTPMTSRTASIRLDAVTRYLSSCESARSLRVDASGRERPHLAGTAELDLARMPPSLRICMVQFPFRRNAPAQKETPTLGAIPPVTVKARSVPLNDFAISGIRITARRPDELVRSAGLAS